jgi:hypothetical protein
VEDEVSGTLGTDAEDDGYMQETCALELPPED